MRLDGGIWRIPPFGAAVHKAFAVSFVVSESQKVWLSHAKAREGVVWCGAVWCAEGAVTKLAMAGMEGRERALCVVCGAPVAEGRQSLWCRAAAVWCGVVWCGVVWCGVVWCGVVWCGVVWCGVVWCGVVWCGVVWCGVVWCGVV